MPSKKKTKNTFHSYDRAAERCGLSKAEAKRLFSAASRSRNSVEKLPAGPLKEYLQRKAQTGKRIKFLEGYVFVLCRTSTKCLTMYKVRDNILKAQQAYDAGQLVAWCPKCKQYFRYEQVPQEPGNRWKEDLSCPKCDEIITTSMEREFWSYEL